MNLNSHYRRLMYLDIMEDRLLVSAEKRLMKHLQEQITALMSERSDIERKAAIGKITKKEFKRHKVISKKLGL